MNYLYHWVPKNMRASVLFPLNQLKETHPEIYKEQANKYIGREHIMLQKIPFLNCLWNDVLHFSPVHPTLIKQALFEAGRTAPFDLEFFEVDPRLLDPNNTIVYLYARDKGADSMKEDNFTQFDPDDLEKYSILPQETKNYYREMFLKNEKPLLFHRVPHVLYKGTIDISNITNITP